jgi:hypothetical protein
LRYYHAYLLPNAPNHSEQARAYATSGAGTNTTTPTGTILPMCQFRSSCDILRNPDDPRRAVHFGRWSHPVVDTAPAIGAAAAALARGAVVTILPITEPSRYSLALNQCSNFPGACNLKDTPHLLKFRHPCPNQFMPGGCHINDEKHLENCMHSCPNGYHCPLRDNDDQHKKLYYHFEATHASKSRGICPNVTIPLHHLDTVQSIDDAGGWNVKWRIYVK